MLAPRLGDRLVPLSPRGVTWLLVIELWRAQGGLEIRAKTRVGGQKFKIEKDSESMNKGVISG